MAQHEVDTPSPDYQDMAVGWELITDELGGTLTMREASDKWLPREPGEEPKNYIVRRQRSILFGGLRNAGKRIVSRPFQKPIALSTTDGVDERVLSIEKDADREGTSLTQFARKLFEDALFYGKSHFLVDFPVVPEGSTATEEDAIGARPYFAHVDALSLIGWQTDPAQKGSKRLTQIRVLSTATVPDGPFSEKKIERMLIYTPEDWVRWERDATTGADWVRVAEGVNQLGKIPLVTVYFDRTGFMTARPPLNEVAWLNLAHWQSNSDQRNILRYARMPILVETGVDTDPESVEAQQVIGAGAHMRLERDEAKVYFAEHSGAAIDSGETDLRHLEEQMELFGLQPLVRRTGMQTATGRGMDETQVETDALAWVRVTETALLEGFEFAAEYVKAELPEDFTVDIFSEFGFGTGSLDALKVLQADNMRGVLPDEDYLHELRRYGLMSEGFDPEKAAALAAERSAMGPVLLDEPEGDDGDGDAARTG